MRRMMHYFDIDLLRLLAHEIDKNKGLKFLDSVGQLDGKRRLEIHSAAHVIIKITQKQERCSKNWVAPALRQFSASCETGCAGCRGETRQRHNDVAVEEAPDGAARHGADSRPAISSGHSVGT